LETHEKVKIKIESEFEEIELPEEIINITIPLNETNITINQTINITPITNETIINQTIINETLENISIDEINIKLEYKSDSIYDKDDDGIENINNIIDLTVEETEFNFNASEENLCTRWETYSVEEEKSTTICYGSSNCCNFIDLLPTRPDWDEPFYAAYGQYDTSLNNIISVQILYVDYNLSLEDPYAEIYYSGLSKEVNVSVSLSGSEKYSVKSIV